LTSLARGEIVPDMPRVPKQRSAARAKVSGAPSPGQPSTTGSVLALQRAVGNRAVRQLLGRDRAPGRGRGDGAVWQLIQRDVKVPEDVAAEMVGRNFRLAKDFVVAGVTHPAGEVVQAQSGTTRALR
jgi:hypothetical protein